MKLSVSTLMKNVFVMVLFTLMVTATATGKEKLPENLRAVIEKIFPGSTITETEEEHWKGEVVTEVELVAKDGTPYEIYLSKEGKVLKVEKEDDFNWFGLKK